MLENDEQKKIFNMEIMKQKTIWDELKLKIGKKLKEKENQEEEMKELNEKMNLKIQSLESDKIYLKEQIDMYQNQLETNALTKKLIENADKGNNKSYEINQYNRKKKYLTK